MLILLPKELMKHQVNSSVVSHLEKDENEEANFHSRYSHHPTLVNLCVHFFTNMLGVLTELYNKDVPIHNMST